MLKLTVPGVPDIYQGSELWDFSLVDPDNRRPVDYPGREQALAALPGADGAGSLLDTWRDGRIKLFVTRTLLPFRREHPELFAKGGYQPLEMTGALAKCSVAFARATESHHVVVIVARHSSCVGAPPIGAAWQDTAVSLETARGEWRNLFTGREHTGALRLAEVLAEFPVAVLVEQR